MDPHTKVGRMRDLPLLACVPQQTVWNLRQITVHARTHVVMCEQELVSALHRRPVCTKLTLLSAICRLPCRTFTEGVPPGVEAPVWASGGVTLTWAAFYGKLMWLLTA